MGANWFGSSNFSSYIFPTVIFGIFKLILFHTEDGGRIFRTSKINPSVVTGSMALVEESLETPRKETLEAISIAKVKSYIVRAVVFEKGETI